MARKMCLTILIFVLSAVTCAELPSNFKKCDRKQTDFQQCLTIAVQDGIRQATHPYKDIGLTGLEPFEVSSFVVGAGSGPVAFEHRYKDVKVAGCTNITCSRVRMDFGTKSFKMECNTPKLTLSFFYDIEGKILLLPIHGKGPGTVVLGDTDYEMTFNFDEYEKKGKKHYKIVDKKLVMSPHFVHINLENLFDGDKVLGDNINKVLNENSADVWADVKPSYEDGLAQVFAAIFDKVLRRVSVSELFGE